MHYKELPEDSVQTDVKNEAIGAKLLFAGTDETV